MREKIREGRIFRILPAILIIALLPPIAAILPDVSSAAGEAERPYESAEARLFGLADVLMKEAEYFRAITEYKRFIYYFPEGRRAEEAYFKIGKAYYLGRNFKQALKALRAYLKRFPEGTWKPEALYLTGLSLAGLGDLRQARTLLREVVSMTDRPGLRDRARIAIARTYIREERWRDAEEILEEITPMSPGYEEAKELLEGLKRIEMNPAKSPALAGVLAAVLPGAGHLYSGRTRDALLSLLVNGAFIGAALEGFDKGNPVIGGITAGLSALWYGGNIFSAISSAHKYNRDRIRDAFREEAAAIGTGDRSLFIKPSIQSLSR